MTRDSSATVSVGGHVIRRDVLDGIRSASRKSGVDFKYLLAQAQRESEFKPAARHGVTSAAGLFQFTRQTWLEVMKGHGADHGYGELAAHIRRTAKGEYVVDDPQVKAAILDLRRDHQASSTMAAEFAKDNRAYLEKALKRPASERDLYLAHFLGPGGAARLLKAQATEPDRPAVEVVPEAGRFNRAVFHDEATDAPRTVAEVTRVLGAAIDRSMKQFAGVNPRPEAAPPIPARRPTMVADAPSPPADASPSPVRPPPVVAAAASVAAGPLPAPPTTAGSAAAYTLLARGMVPPPISTATETMQVAQADHTVVATLPMPPLADTNTVSGPGRAESVIDIIFRSLFSRTTT